VKIDIDIEQCGNPLDCRLCIDRCPEKVFGTYPRGRRHPGVAPGDWVIIPLFSSQCTDCRECLDFCPKQAILVQRLSLRQKIGNVISLVRDIVRKDDTVWAWK
jgi:ferredoxin